MTDSGRVRVAIVGFGYWGPNLVRNFGDNDRTVVRTICDRSNERLEFAARRHPQAVRTTDFATVCADPEIDLVAIATPITTHFELAKAAMLAGKDVFVEKPLCTTAAEAAELGQIAAKHGRRVFVDHTFVYNPAVRKLQALVHDADFGRPLYYDSVRANLGLFQSDINVLWDLAPHDLSILDYVLDGAVPTTVSCVGAAHFNGTQNIAYLSLVYDGGFIAHCHLSWLAPVKIRQVIFAGSNKFLIYDDNDPVERIKVYDKGVSVLAEDNESRDARRIQYRTGDVLSPFVPNHEALKVEVDHIAACYFDGASPLTGIAAGTNMVRILEAADRSMNDGGIPIRL
jgi:predicted dehydrogenase